MKKQNAAKTAEIIGKELEEGKDSELLKDITVKMNKVKMNAMLRKNLAKSLSIDEKKALEWNIVADVFSCLDTATLAKEHPKDCARIVKTVASIVALFFPPALVVDVLPATACAKVVEYSGTITPEHVIKRVADSKKDTATVDTLIENNQPEQLDKPNNETIETNVNESSADELLKWKKLYDMGAITIEEYNEKKKQLLEK